MSSIAEDAGEQGGAPGEQRNESGQQGGKRGGGGRGRGRRNRRGRYRRGRGRRRGYQRRPRINYAVVAKDALKDFMDEVSTSSLSLLKVTKFPEGIKRYREVRREVNKRLEGAGIREKDGYHPKFEITGSEVEEGVFDFKVYLLLDTAEHREAAVTALSDGKEGTDDERHAFDVEDVDTIEGKKPIEYFAERLADAEAKIVQQEAEAAERAKLKAELAEKAKGEEAEVSAENDAEAVETEEAGETAETE